MDNNFRIRAAAYEDLEDIGIESRKEWGEGQMRVYVTEIIEAFRSLGSAPALGRSCDDIFEGCRRFLVGAHVIFYEIGQDGVVEVVRVLHGRMQHDQHFLDDE